MDAVDADMSSLDELLVSERTRVLCCVRSLVCCVPACPLLPILEEALKKTVITSADAVTTGRLFSHQVKASRAPQDQHPHERQVEWRRPFPPFAPSYCLPIDILARLLWRWSDVGDGDLICFLAEKAPYENEGVQNPGHGESWV